MFLGGHAADYRCGLPLNDACDDRMQVGMDGAITSFLQDPDGSRVNLISSVVEVKGRLWMGSVTNHYVAYLDL